jgi:ABC-type glycerol-3-phosphate transport system substrate-binding protein
MKAAIRSLLLAALLACAGCGTTHSPATQTWWASMPNAGSDGGGGGGSGGGGGM